MNSTKEIFRHLAENHQVYLPTKELEAIKIELEGLIPTLGYFGAIKEVERIALVLKPKYKNPALGAYKSDVMDKPKKAVNQIDPKTGEVVATYPSLYKAGKAFAEKGGQSNIHRAINKNICAFGFKWEEK